MKIKNIINYYIWFKKKIPTLKQLEMSQLRENEKIKQKLKASLIDKDKKKIFEYSSYKRI